MVSGQLRGSTEAINDRRVAPLSTVLKAMEEDISGTGQPVWIVDMRLKSPTGHTEIMAVRNALHVGNAAPIRLSYWPEERCKCGELIFMSAHSAHEREAKSSQRVERL